MSSPMACSAGACSACESFRGSFADLQVRILRLSLCQKDLQPFHLSACLEACLRTARREMFSNVSRGTMAYDASFAKSKILFASTIATFRGRSCKPAVAVLCKNFHMGFSGDAQMKLIFPARRAAAANGKQFHKRPGHGACNLGTLVGPQLSGGR